MKNKFKHLSLFKQFTIFLVIILFLPTTLISFISYIRATYQIQNMVSELTTQLSVNVSAQLDGMISDINWLSLQIANKPEVRDFVTSEEDDYVKKYYFMQKIEKDAILEQLYSRIAVVNGVSILGNSGITYSTQNNKRLEDFVYSMGDDTVLSRRELFQKSLSEEGSMKIIVSKPVSQTNSNEEGDGYIITFGRRIFATNSLVPKGILAVDVRSESLNKLWERKDLKNGFIWIVDSQGQIMYYPDKSKIGLMVDDIVDSALLKKGSGSFRLKQSDSEKFFVYVTSETTGWRTIATFPLDSINMPAEDMKNSIFYTYIITFFITMAVGYLFVRSITKPIRILEKGMRELSKGNWNQINEPMPLNEVGSLISGFNVMTKKISDLIDKVYKAELKQQAAELLKQKAEFQALQTQINPHFLYNTLGTINTFAMVSEEEGIQEMVEALGKMLRYSVQNSLESVSLREELEHLGYYTTIQKYRFRNMPNLVFDLERYTDYRILRLTLQPLVENIFHHAFPDGVQPDSKIVISAREQDDFFVVEVLDNGIGLDLGDTESIFEANNTNIKLGIGLINVHRRIQIAFGEKYGLKISGSKGKGTSVKMILPLVTENLDIK